jgi:hypothetical protein
MKFAVVGSGPCGALTALLLLENGYSVDLISLNNVEKSDKKNLERGLKTVDGDSSSYDVNQILKIEVGGKDATFYRSKVTGGFSSVWGATWGSPKFSQDESWLRNYEKVTKKVHKSLGFSTEMTMKGAAESSGCDCLSFLNDLVSEKISGITRSDLAINNFGCSCISSGNDHCIHGAVWNSSFLINECTVYDTFRLLTSLEVRKIGSNADGLYIQSDSEELRYDSITLAAGPLGISSILLYSDFHIEKVLLSETRMAYMPYLRFRLNSGHPGAFAFSQHRFDLEDSSGEVAAHIQLYAHSDLYMKRIESKVPSGLRFAVRMILNILTPHMGIALIYVSSEYSETLKITRSHDSYKLLIDLSKPGKKRFGFLKKLGISFKELGLCPVLPALSWAKVGESYHLGAAQDHLDEYGFLKSEPRLSVAGSFALPKVLPGPITHAAMAQSSRLVERIVHQNLESN